MYEQYNALIQAQNGTVFQVIPKTPAEILGEKVLSPIVSYALFLLQKIDSFVPNLPSPLPGVEAIDPLQKIQLESSQTIENVNAVQNAKKKAQEGSDRMKKSEDATHKRAASLEKLKEEKAEAERERKEQIEQNFDECPSIDECSLPIYNATIKQHIAQGKVCFSAAKREIDEYELLVKKEGCINDNSNERVKSIEKWLDWALPCYEKALEIATAEEESPTVMEKIKDRIHKIKKHLENLGKNIAEGNRKAQAKKNKEEL